VPHVEQAGHGGGVRLAEDVRRPPVHVVDVVVGQQEVGDVQRHRHHAGVRDRQHVVGGLEQVDGRRRLGGGVEVAMAGHGRVTRAEVVGGDVDDPAPAKIALDGGPSKLSPRSSNSPKTLGLDDAS
jgi:hypothetical protein